MLRNWRLTVFARTSSTIWQADFVGNCWAWKVMKDWKAKGNKKWNKFSFKSLVTVRFQNLCVESELPTCIVSYMSQHSSRFSSLYDLYVSVCCGNPTSPLILILYWFFFVDWRNGGEEWKQLQCLFTAQRFQSTSLCFELNNRKFELLNNHCCSDPIFQKSVRRYLPVGVTNVESRKCLEMSRDDELNRRGRNDVGRQYNAIFALPGAGSTKVTTMDVQSQPFRLLLSLLPATKRRWPRRLSPEDDCQSTPDEEYRYL